MLYSSGPKNQFQPHLFNINIAKTGLGWGQEVPQISHVIEIKEAEIFRNSTKFSRSTSKSAIR